MFSSKRAPQPESFSKRSESFQKRHRERSSSKAKRSFREYAAASSRVEKKTHSSRPSTASTLTSPIITLCVGPDQRLFAAHEDILSSSPYFATIARGQFLEANAKRVNLPDELPEIFSCVLEYLYKGDYFPRLQYHKRRNSWELEDIASENTGKGSILYHPTLARTLLKDTLVYCTAEKFGLEELKSLALRKQGLQTGVQCSTILASARYAYANTPDTDSRLRAHYLALIIRSRSTFKRSGTMQSEMELGGRLFFDLFVAMCNHMDEMSTIKSPRSVK